MTLKEKPCLGLHRSFFLKITHISSQGRSQKNIKILHLEKQTSAYGNTKIKRAACTEISSIEMPCRRMAVLCSFLPCETCTLESI